MFVSVSVCVFLVLFPCMCFLGGAGCASPSVRVRLLDLGVVVDFVAAAFRNFEGTSHNPAGETFFQEGIVGGKICTWCLCMCIY